jgi:hypothetical protein
MGEMSVAYVVAPIANANTYTWIVPAGVTIVSGNNTNSILVDFGATAVSGTISVTGINTCGSGTASPNFAVTVNPIPTAPTITVLINVLTSSASAGNQWYFEGTAITGATGQTYTVLIQSGFYWDVVTLNGCESDTSNHQSVIVEGIDKQIAPSLTIVPVPNNGQFKVTITSPSQETYTLQVFNNMGAMIREIPGIEVKGTVDQVIDLRPIADGMYTVALRNGTTGIVKKIIVRN